MEKILALIAVCALATSANAAIVTIDLAGVNSWDSFRSPNNEVLSVAAGTEIIGFSLDNTVIETVGGSWLSHTEIDIENQLYVIPGEGDDFPGTNSQPYSSGGMMYFSDYGYPNIVVDGFCDIEFYEDNDDVTGAIDAAFISGTLTLEYVPEPASLALLGFGGLAMLRRRR